MTKLWSVICELSQDEDRRRMANSLLQKRPYIVDDNATREDFEKARAILLGMRDLPGWATLLHASRVWAALLDVRSPIAASMLHTAARRAQGDPQRFRDELADFMLTPARRGPKRDRLPDYLADQVVLAYQWLTGGPPPLGDPYDDARSVAGSALYRLGEVTFREHGVRWHASRVLKAARRYQCQFGVALLPNL
jgi:hypothetical protein